MDEQELVTQMELTRLGEILIEDVGAVIAGIVEEI